jgi:hypothetical protein
MRKLWIEAALNGPWSRSFNRALPIRLRRSSPRASPARAPAPPSFTPTPTTAAACRPTIGRQLRDLAEEVEMPFLSYLLGMVIFEAEKALQDGRRNDGIQAMPLVADLARN